MSCSRTATQVLGPAKPQQVNHGQLGSAQDQQRDERREEEKAGRGRPATSSASRGSPAATACPARIDQQQQHRQQLYAAGDADAARVAPSELLRPPVVLVVVAAANAPPCTSRASSSPAGAEEPEPDNIRQEVRTRQFRAHRPVVFLMSVYAVQHGKQSVNGRKQSVQHGVWR